MLLGRVDVYCKSKFKDMLILNHADIHYPHRVNLDAWGGIKEDLDELVDVVISGTHVNRRLYAFAYPWYADDTN